jgi:tight adherence protein C
MLQALLLSICAFLMLLVLLSWVAYRIFYKPGKFLRQLGNPVISGAARRPVLDEQVESEGSSVVTLLRSIGAHVPTSSAEVATLRTELVRGGYRSETAAPVFYGLRIVTTVAMMGLSLLLQSNMPENPAMRMALLLFGTVSGWILPRFFLEKRIAKRQEILRLSLPDALDLLVVSVEAGLGLDQAMQHVGRELAGSHPELSEELSMVTMEMRAGSRRSEAMRNFGERTGEPEIKKLVAILVQNDRFGTSMGESLRTHSDFLRSRRRQDAEERAGKVGVKLVFPIFFFILPSMLVVAAGPGILQIFKSLFPMMKQIQ